MDVEQPQQPRLHRVMGREVDAREEQRVAVGERSRPGAQRRDRDGAPQQLRMVDGVGEERRIGDFPMKIDELRPARRQRFRIVPLGRRELGVRLGIAGPAISAQDGVARLALACVRSARRCRHAA